jgi:hypothetical protein
MGLGGALAFCSITKCQGRDGKERFSGSRFWRSRSLVCPLMRAAEGITSLAGAQEGASGHTLNKEAERDWGLSIPFEGVPPRPSH